MGIDIHAFNFLRHARGKGPLGSVLTIGRQGLFVPERVVNKIFQTGLECKNETYCEKLLIGFFEASAVESIDNSSYEGASNVHDMNRPLPSALVSRFDTVFDGGCLEHIYNVPQALMNCSLACKPGGQVLHVLPANNFCGHGFFQFSPELFFSLYSHRNGYHDVEVFMADVTNLNVWYQVIQPSNGERVTVESSSALYVLVRAVRTGREFSHAQVQQSDYVSQWESFSGRMESDSINYSRFKSFVRKNPFIHLVSSILLGLYLRVNNATGLNPRNPGLRFRKLRNSCERWNVF